MFQICKFAMSWNDKLVSGNHIFSLSNVPLEHSIKEKKWNVGPYSKNLVSFNMRYLSFLFLAFKRFPKFKTVLLLVIFSFQIILNAFEKFFILI